MSAESQLALRNACTKGKKAVRVYMKCLADVNGKHFSVVFIFDRSESTCSQTEIMP